MEPHMDIYRLLPRHSQSFVAIKQSKQNIFIILASCLHIFTGPAEDIYEEDYYKNMKKALKPNGVLCSQGSDNFTFNKEQTILFIYNHYFQKHHNFIISK